MRATIAVSELLYPKPRMLSGFFNEKKPPSEEAGNRHNYSETALEDSEHLESDESADEDACGCDDEESYGVPDGLLASGLQGAEGAE